MVILEVLCDQLVEPDRRRTISDRRSLWEGDNGLNTLTRRFNSFASEPLIQPHLVKASYRGFSMELQRFAIEIGTLCVSRVRRKHGEIPKRVRGRSDIVLVLSRARLCSFYALA